MPRYLHIPHTPDTARTLTLTGFDCGDKERSTHDHGVGSSHDHGVGSSDYIQKSVIYIMTHYLFHFHLCFVYLKK